MLHGKRQNNPGHVIVDIGGEEMPGETGMVRISRIKGIVHKETQIFFRGTDKMDTIKNVQFMTWIRESSLGRLSRK